MKRTQPKPELPEIADEPGWQDRFHRGLQRALSTPAKHKTATNRKSENQLTPKRRRDKAQSDP